MIRKPLSYTQYMTLMISDCLLGSDVCMHWLATEKERIGASRTTVGRSNRTCRICGCRDREDEVHVLMCGGYKVLHREFTHVFETEQYKNLKTAYDNGDMTDDLIKDFMNQSDRLFVMGFAGFLRRSFALRKRLLDSRPM